MPRYTIKSATAKFSAYGTVNIYKNTTVTATNTNNMLIGWYYLRYSDEFGSVNLCSQTLVGVVEQLKYHLTESRQSEAIMLCRETSCDLSSEPEQYIGHAHPISVHEHDTAEFEALSEGYGFCNLIQRLESGVTLPYLSQGYSFQYAENGAVTVFCPDGSTFTLPYLLVALEAIDLGFYNLGQSCPVEYHYSPVDEFGYQEVVCIPQTGLSEALERDDQLLLSQGYNPEIHWLAGDKVLTLDGDRFVGNIGEPYYQPAYLSESEFYKDAHLMEF
jgi:hypothetical protein